MNDSLEFWIIAGGLLFAGSLVVCALLAIVFKMDFFKRKKTIIKELYDEKERKNGQSKGGSRGQY